MISLIESVVAACLALFIVVNLDNLLRYNAIRSSASSKPEIEKRIAAPLLLTGIGTVAFFVESFLYVIQDYWENLHVLVSSTDIGMIRVGLLQYVGAFVMVLGYVIFIWSVLVRGRYATSWQMPEDHRLVDRGPYRYVRHPSYLAYFLMFTGFLLMWGNFLALVPLVAVPGYVMLTFREEEMLVAKFGERYVQYRKHVGRYLPKIRPVNHSFSASLSMW
jgi:protein-S-isoprenylcysteine O-methyltransferase Ste14